MREKPSLFWIKTHRFDRSDEQRYACAACMKCFSCQKYPHSIHKHTRKKSLLYVMANDIDKRDTCMNTLAHTGLSCMKCSYSTNLSSARKTLFGLNVKCDFLESNSFILTYTFTPERNHMFVRYVKRFTWKRHGIFLHTYGSEAVRLLCMWHAFRSFLDMLLTRSGKKAHLCSPQGEKQYECNDVLLSFRRFGSLRIWRIHTVQTLYTCEICRKQFLRMDF
jgi:hypothetical protein